MSKKTFRPAKRVYKRRFAKISHYGNALSGGWSRGGNLPVGNRAKLHWYAGAGNTLTDAAVAFELWEVRVDSLFQPEAANTHQPRGFDQWMAMYQFYKVLRVKIVVTTTFVALSDAEAEVLNNAMVIKYQVRGIALPAAAVVVLADEYERKTNRLRRFTLDSTKSVVIRDVFNIDPWSLVKSVAGRQDSKADSGWATVTTSPVYETGAIPSFGALVSTINTTFPTSVEIKRELMMTFDCAFKRPVQLAASTV